MKEAENISLIDQHVIDFVWELRKKRNLTQDDIASILGLSRTYIASVENKKERAKYNLTHINALADYFGMSPKDFMPENPLIADKDI